MRKLPSLIDRSVDDARRDWLIWTIAICCAAFPAAAADQPSWKAGVAKAIITPDTSVWLAGYGGRPPPDGKLHDLYMKALALETDDGQRVVLITSDFQGVPKVMSDPVFAEVKDRYDLERARIMFTFSHNHCGPRL